MSRPGQTSYSEVERAERRALAELSPEEQHSLEEKQKAMDALLKEKGIAKYKLEVMFHNARSMKDAFAGAVTFWESGTKLHGGGDAKMYLCPGKERKGNGCTAFIHDASHGLTFLVCSSCGQLWKTEEVFGEVFYRLPIQKWADVLTTWFMKLNMDADIRIKYARDDIRSVAMKEQERDRGGELLGKVRSDARRSTSVYPLKNIIKDTNAGADLRGRILAYLKA